MRSRTFRVTASTLDRRLDCTAEGIRSGCGGKCCRTRAFWPPNADPQADGCSCHYLGPDGCSLAGPDRPVKCLLYPLLSKPGVHTLGVYFRAKSVTCGPCYGRGPTLAEVVPVSSSSSSGPSLRCPACGSADVSCAIRRGRRPMRRWEHRHECLGCGLVDIWADVR